MMNDINKILPNRYKEDELKRVEQIEKTSYEVIVTYNKIFYVMDIQSGYYEAGIVLFWSIKKIHGLRVTARIEEEGLDIYEHGETAYNS